MKLITHTVLEMDQNVYIYFDESTKDGVIIDPGNDAKDILHLVSENNVKVKAILLTHGHSDHMGAVPEVKKALNCPVAAHKWEVPVLEDERANLSGMIYGAMTFTPDIIFEDDDEFKFGNCTLRVLHTPGHTQGGVCYYDAKNKVLFSGDTLFHASIGRTDFPNPPIKDGMGYPSYENFDRLIGALRDKIMTLPEDTEVYPGHGNKTSIEFEKESNPFLE